MEILANIRINNKKYISYTDGNEIIKFAEVGEKDNLLLINDPYILGVLEKMTNKIMISQDMKNHIKLNKIHYNSKLFQVMYDKTSKFKFFYEIIDDKNCVPSQEDFISLFRIFNYEALYIKSEKSSIEKIKDKKYWFKRTLTTVIGAAAISISLACLYNSFFDSYRIEYIDPPATITSLEESYLESLDSKEKLSIDKLLTCLNSNIHLSQKEKDIFLGYIEYIEANKDCFDAQDLYCTFKSTCVVYFPEDGPDGILGTWNSFYISIYGAKEFNYNIYETLVHESGHATSKWESAFLGVGISEAYASVLTEEYKYDVVEKEKNHYYYEQELYLKMLFEIIGTEPFIKSQGKGEIFYVIDALKEVIPDEEMAIKLVQNIDMTLLEGVLKSVAGSEDDIEGFAIRKQLFDMKGDFKKSREELYSAISDYFYAAKGYSMEEDFIMMAYYSKLVSLPENIDSVRMDVNIYNVNNGYDVNGTYPIELKNINISKGYLIPSYIRSHSDYNFDCKVFVPVYETTNAVSESVYSSGTSSETMLDYYESDETFTIKDNNRRIVNGNIYYGQMIVNDLSNNSKSEGTPPYKQKD